MSKSQRDKGNRFEREVVNYLKEKGFHDGSPPARSFPGRPLARQHRGGGSRCAKGLSKCGNSLREQCAHPFFTVPAPVSWGDLELVGPRSSPPHQEPSLRARSPAGRRLERQAPAGGARGARRRRGVPATPLVLVQARTGHRPCGCRSSP